ncbi:ParB N-terminal domain-containing protein [Phreatobacter sp.]|uniref:ParB N-terminal domain-containing protein n=1 Tax=Phreatobacter sp. TaxID=1966341 RepID=UPI0025DA0DC4|nr:ParB N-terminal domain-containing protein [Phreatobacter sp.]
MPNPPKLSSSPKTDLIELETIVVNDRWQVRGALDSATVKRYADAMSAGAQFPPIVLASLNGALILVSGFHRYHAAKLARQTALMAEVHQAKPERLLWRAAAENLAHGLPMKAKDHRGAFRAYVQSGMHRLPNGKVKASRTIAEELNNIRSHATILNWMRSDFPSVSIGVQS